MKNKIYVSEILKLHREKSRLWHQFPIRVSKDKFVNLVEKNHLYNFLIWHQEDLARQEEKGYRHVCEAKRRIDVLNQKRNNLIEDMDRWIFRLYKPSQKDGPFHSETPGMIIDRLSIMALRYFHMARQSVRTDQNLKIISRQIVHVGGCLKDLLTEIQKRKRSFRLYEQLKMYNDPRLTLIPCPIRIDENV